MKDKNQELANSLVLEVVRYILSDHREQQDYKEHCQENDLDPDDFLNNADLPGGHIYAKAKLMLFFYNLIGMDYEV